jgi:hypothetical protein
MAGNKISLTDRTAQTNYSDSIPSEADEELVLERCDDEDLHPEEEGSARHAHSEAGSTMQSSHLVSCGGVVMTKRRLGMLSAVFCGIWGGSILAPMKWCKSDVKGVGYLISFAIGASIVTISLWIMRYSYYIHKYGSPRAAYEQLPSFHFRVMWKAGGLCGLLWSIGNFFSLYSVLYLGEGVGYPLVQTSIFVSGLWGIFYFKVRTMCLSRSVCDVPSCVSQTHTLCASLLSVGGTRVGSHYQVVALILGHHYWHYPVKLRAPRKVKCRMLLQIQPCALCGTNRPPSTRVVDHNISLETARIDQMFIKIPSCVLRLLLQLRRVCSS